MNQTSQRGMHASDTPPGWNYNPSAWPQRLPLVGVALVGLAIAAYLMFYQLGWVDIVWEPFFGDGSRRILTSSVSRVLPIPDAALGALGYLVDAVAGMIGGPKRWHTAPWIVILFGMAVGPLGAVSVLLVVLQPVAIGAWCTLCLASAFTSVVMIGPAMDELLASLQVLQRQAREGRSVWKAFWSGVDERELSLEQTSEVREVASAEHGSRPGGKLPMIARVANLALGIWLMAAPSLLDYGNPARDNHLVIGPWVAALAIVALSQVTRFVRHVNLLLGLWLIVSPIWLDSGTAAGIVSVLTGSLVAALSFQRGSHPHYYGEGWRGLLKSWRHEIEHA